MAMLTRDALLAKKPAKIEKVDLPDGEFVFVREMSGRERDQFEQSIMEEVRDKKGRSTFRQNLTDFRAKLAVMTICDEQGSLLLGQADAPLLSINMSAAALDLIVTAAQKLNAISKEDQDALVGESEPGQTEGSPSVFAGS